MAWTDELVDLLKSRWADGASAQEIANEFNRAFPDSFTRNAIIGKVSRLGLPQRSRAAARAAGRINAKANLLGRAERKPAAPKLAKPPQPPKVPFPAPAPNTIPLAPRPWLTRRPHECAYPVSGEGADTVSCCNPCEGTYCAPHVAFMTTKPSNANWSEEQRAKARARAIAMNQAKRNKKWAA